MCTCVQLHSEWDLTARVHKPGWGIIYLLIIHNKHPDLDEYNRAAGLDGIVVGEDTEEVDEAKAQANAETLKRVKCEEKKRGHQTNPGINALSKEPEKSKKARRSGRSAADSVQFAVVSALQYTNTQSSLP